MSRRVLVTGCSGFVGRAVSRKLLAAGDRVVGAVRSATKEIPRGIESVVPVGEISGTTDWYEALRGVDAVIHLAARCHVVQERSANPEEAFLRVNVEGSRKLADDAAAAEVARFVYVSTIGVNGESTSGTPFNEGAPAAPQGPYAKSKAAAERELQRIADESGMELVVIRPPLVYGPGAPGNFGRLVRWVKSGLPLPFAAVRNRRSLIGLENLADVLERCVRHPGVTGRLFLVSDGEDLSTADVVRAIAFGLGVKPKLFPIPASMLLLGAAAIGRRPEVVRLIGDLQIDSSAIRRHIGWQPPIPALEGLRRSAFDVHVE